MSNLKLAVNLENCYGIKKIDCGFDFSQCHTFVIYAPNGAMKTSFANTFKDLANNKEPCDRMDDSLAPTYKVINAVSGAQILPETICIIEPYNEKAFDSEDKVLTLLADEKIRKEYLDIYSELDIEKLSLIKILKKVSRSNNCEAELVSAFSTSNESIFEIFLNLVEDARKFSEKFDFKYNSIFDPQGKVKEFLDENKLLFEQYCKKYEDLISHSDFFAKCGGTVFGTTEAKNISDSVKGNEFFSAGHGLSLKKYGDVGNNERFVEIIDEEVQKIFNDKGLKDIFDKVEKKLVANQALTAFKKTIEKDPSLVIRINDYEQFRKDAWYSYLCQMINELDNLVDLYKKKKSGIEAIIAKANGQRSMWEDTIQEFKDRFINVPFTLDIENKSDAILNMRTPTISFKFKDKQVDRKKMIDILSQGEKRAFYILNVIFEVKSRQLSDKETLFIIDDIADSFDYQNKYAIVEYLHDISSEPNFYSIILTHNYDFYRTITSRLGVPRENRLHAVKTKNEVEINEEVYQNNPFKTWRENMKSGKYFDKLYTDSDARKHIIALIPFVRNLIEYNGSTESSTTYGDDYNALTSLLHAKGNTKNITFGDLKKIYLKHLSKDDFDSSIIDANIIFNEIINLADNIGDEEFNLENKIILSMAIRHKAEEYMWSKVTDKTPIGGTQTGKLFKRFKDEFKGDPSYKDLIRTLESVNIMTPENIHLNSFMYEPILDMGIDELKNLYRKSSGLI